MKGIAKGTTHEGVRVMRIHYTADPDKDPATPVGAKWLVKELVGCHGGMDGAKWQREYEINPDAVSGQLVFPAMMLQKSKIIIQPFEIPETWEISASFDYAGRGFSAFLVHAKAKGESDFYTIWEWCKQNAGRSATAEAIKTCPYFNRFSFIVADPSIWADTQIRDAASSVSDELVSVAQLFAEKGIHFIKGNKGGDHAFAELVNTELWQDIQATRQPTYRIFNTCPEHIREMSAWRYNDWSAGTQVHKNLKETMVDKDNHTIDCAKYYFQKKMAHWLAEWVKNFNRDIHVLPGKEND